VIAMAADDIHVYPVNDLRLTGSTVQVVPVSRRSR
jgi:hypothetical protein